MWDNRCTQHKVLNDFDEERIIQRVTVMGDRPEGRQTKWPVYTSNLNASDTSRYDAPLVEYFAKASDSEIN